jgi:hypothetical protein
MERKIATSNVVDNNQQHGHFMLVLINNTLVDREP